jgi:hypothetical protein
VLVAVVALFRTFALAIAAHRANAGKARLWAHPAVTLADWRLFELTRGATPVAVRDVSVIALLAPRHDPVATGRLADSARRADPARLEPAVDRAAVTASLVAVVARFSVADIPVATPGLGGSDSHARRAGLAADESRLDGAARRAPVTISEVAIVARFSVIEATVATRGADRLIACVELHTRHAPDSHGGTASATRKAAASPLLKIGVAWRCSGIRASSHDDR